MEVHAFESYLQGLKVYVFILFVQMIIIISQLHICPIHKDWCPHCRNLHFKSNNKHFSSFGILSTDLWCSFLSLCASMLSFELLCPPPCYKQQQQQWVTQCVKHDVIRVFLFSSWCPELLTGGQTMLLHWARGKEKREAPVTRGTAPLPLVWLS